MILSWDLEFGVWNFGFCDFVFGVCLWDLKFGFYDFEFWMFWFFVFGI